MNRATRMIRQQPMRKIAQSYAVRTADLAKLQLLHNLGRLAEPERTHRFC